MKKFLTTTATALILSTGAYADAHNSAFMDIEFQGEANIYASEFIGMRVYQTENETGETVVQNGEAEWDDIGEINDVILTRSGEVSAVIVGVGGFLGLGERDVAVDMTQIKFVNDEDDADDYFLVINANQKMLENAQPFSRDNHDSMEKTASADVEKVENERPMLNRPVVERSGYGEAEKIELTSENLTGARVYGAKDEDIGEVSELILSDGGIVDKVILDVGGFLGLGEKQVAVTFDELQILRSDDGDDFRVYIDATQEALEQQPEYDS